MPDASIILCTHNRSHLLNRAMESLTRVRFPDAVTWDVVVVLSACTDDSLKTAEKYIEILPVKIIEDPVGGLSRARNLGLRASTGSFVLWVDDDVVVDQDWFTAHWSGQNQFPDCAFFGGAVKPYFEIPPAKWVTKNLKLLSRPLVDVNFGPNMRRFNPHEAPAGANMSFRRSVLKSDHPFDENIGQFKKSELRGDDQLFFADLIGQGDYGIWLPGARVKHFTQSERISEEGLSAYFFGLGRTQAITGGKAYPKFARHLPKIICIIILRMISTFFRLGEITARLLGSDIRIWFLLRRHQMKGIAFGIENHDVKIAKAK